MTKENIEAVDVVKSLRGFVADKLVEIAEADGEENFAGGEKYLEWLDYQIATRCEGYITDYLIKDVKRKHLYAAENAEWVQISFLIPNALTTGVHHFKELYEKTEELLGHGKFAGMCSEVPILFDDPFEGVK